MPSATLPSVLMQITDGHGSPAAEEARRTTECDSFPAVEQIVRIAVLRRARENALRARVFGEVPGEPAGAAGRQQAGESLG